MHLVDNINLIAAYFGGVDGGFAKVADILNACVGGSVYLDNIVKAAFVRRAADFALQAGLAVLRVKAVYCFCKDTRAGGFAGTA